MLLMLKTSNPYLTLINDLFSLSIFDRSLNGFLNILVKDDIAQIILIERRFKNTHDKTMNAGYILIQCFQESITDEHLGRFRFLIEKIVKEKVQGNYMDLSPIIIAPDFSHSVLQFIDDYNRMQNRQPIETYQYSQ